MNFDGKAEKLDFLEESGRASASTGLTRGVS
jgi:hypothetical protein